MTLVIAIKTKDSIVWGSDGVGIKGDVISKLGHPKWVDIDNVRIGLTGYAKFFQVFEYMKLPKHKKSFSDKKYIVKKVVPRIVKGLRKSKLVKDDEEWVYGDFIIGYKGKLFAVLSDFYVKEVEWYNVGCVEDFANGLLMPFVENSGLETESVKRAVLQTLKYSAKYNCAINKPFYVDVQGV